MLYLWQFNIKIIILMTINFYHLTTYIIQSWALAVFLNLSTFSWFRNPLSFPKWKIILFSLYNKLIGLGVGYLDWQRNRLQGLGFKEIGNSYIKKKYQKCQARWVINKKGLTGEVVSHRYVAEFINAVSRHDNVLCFWFCNRQLTDLR